nr:hypothetical protein [Tanacetum cinerariifolium]
KLYKMAGTKEMWEAIKSKFDRNVESKKMQKYLLKQQFEGFSVSASEGLHKGYDRFQTLRSQLEIHGDGVSHKDANQKFLRSLPSSWSQVALIIRTKSRLDTPSFDDLYNNLRLFERDVKGTTESSSSNTQNVAFVSTENTSSTNDVSTAYSVSSLSISKSQKEGSPSYTDEIIHSFFANQSSAPQLDCDDLEQINDDDLEEMDLKCKRRDGGYNGHKARDNGKRPAYQDDSKALVTIDEEAIDWSRHVEEDTQNFAMMAYSSSNSDSDNEENMLRDYYCWLKIYCYSCKLKLLDDVVDIKLRLLEQSAAASVQTSSAVVSLYLSRGNLSLLAMGKSSGNGNSSLAGNPHHALKDKGIIDSGCSRHMTGNMSYLSDFEEINGRYVAFGGNQKGGKIIDTECIVLSPEFKLSDENQVLLRFPRENNMYHLDLKNIVSSGDLTCLFAKATLDESNLWHRRLGHINFKTMNKLVK